MGPSAPLGSQIMRRALSALFTAGAAIALPLSVCGHGSEFLLAKVEMMKDTSLLVEVTADYGENPMLSSEAEARDALKDALNVRIGERSLPLGSVVPVRFEKRSQQDPSAPLPRDPQSEGKPHQLLTASWRWKPAEGSLAFEVPASTPHTLIMWVMDESQPQLEPKWRMLISGDVSPPINIPRGAWAMDKFTIGLVLALLLTAIGAAAMRLRKKTAPTASNT